MPGQELEIPGGRYPYGGGAGLPSPVPSREWRLGQSLRGLANQVLGSPRKAISGALDRARARESGCCPCPGQQGRRMPHDQPPYSEPPGLGQPPRPQKPFQGPDTDPCDEMWKRMGIDPQDPCARKLMRRAAPRRRKAARRAAAPRRRAPRRMAARSRYSLTTAKRARLANYMDLYRVGEAEARRALGFPAVSAPGRRKVKARGVGAPRSRRVPARRSQAPRTARGRYELLQNGACYDPVARKFVKRALCR